MRKRIKLVIQLFKEAGKAVQAMPLLLFQPLVVRNKFLRPNSQYFNCSIIIFQTFLALGIALCCWLVVAILIETSGKATESIESGTIECTFRKDSFSIVGLLLEESKLNQDITDRSFPSSFQDGGTYL